MSTGAGPASWPRTLDMRALLEEGWRPSPFQNFIIKIHSRCNLTCDYCYMYEMADQSWRRQPRRMTRPLIDRVAARIAEHAGAHRLRQVDITLHGGEPLLAGVDHTRYALATLRAALPASVRASFSVQTNGILLDEMFLDLFAEYDVAVGVSIDGDEDGHDLHRKRADGRGSYQSVKKGMDVLRSPPYRRLFSGILSTIDLRNDPVHTYESLLAFGPPGLDFLLPHGNWDTPPPHRGPDATTPYADWLIAVFDRWYHAPAQETRIRLFTEIIKLLLGDDSASESVGLTPVVIVVVETGGQIEQVDTLKSAFDGAADTALHVSRDPFSAALLMPEIAARQIGIRGLAKPCQSCEMLLVCGGGLYTHRYSSGAGFLNPSVYCRDLFRLIAHIRETVAADLAKRRAPGLS